MPTDIYSVNLDTASNLWNWTRLPYGNPAACTFYSHESFSTIAAAVAAAKAVSFGNGIFSFLFDCGKVTENCPKSEKRAQWLTQQVRNAETLADLETATQALYCYDLDLYYCASRTLVAYKRNELCAQAWQKITRLPFVESKAFALAA